MIQVEHLTKHFGKSVAVDNISFSIARGEIVGLLGPNGAGKTTTMRILSCFLPPSKGSVTIAGLDAVTDSLEIRRITGYMPENVPLYPEMRVNEYLHFRAKLKGVYGILRRQRVNQVLELCGLTDVAKFIIGRLSKGYRQRVGLADALVHDPQILILDEPTIGLDPNQIRQTRALILDLAKQHTVVLSTHILPEVEMLCSRVLIMNKGHIVASDTPDLLKGLIKGYSRFEAELGGPLDPILARFSTVKGVIKATGQTQGEWNTIFLECLKDADVRAELSAIAAENKWPLRELRSSPGRNFEDIFAELTREGPAS